MKEILEAFASIPESQRIAFELTINLVGLFCCASLFLINLHGYNEGNKKQVLHTQVLFWCVVAWLLLSLTLLTLEILI